MTELSRRVVVVSPHPDDAVISLGAFIARTVRSGARLEVLTVFAGNPESTAPAGEWDGRSGFRSAGEAARGRRLEDQRACARLGATPVWLPFPDDQYPTKRDTPAVLAALDAALSGAHFVLVPGFPLLHDDHAWVADKVLSRPPDGAHVGLYVEWPYAYAALAGGSAPEVPRSIRDHVAAGVTFGALRAPPWDLVRKWTAVRCYRSQLPLLGRLVGRSPPGAARLLWAEQRAWSEGVAWLS